LAEIRTWTRARDIRREDRVFAPSYIEHMKRYLLVAYLLISGLPAQASITAVGGSGNILAAGPGVGYTADFFGDPTLVVHGWNEVQNYTLTANLQVDTTTLGAFNSTASLTPGFIPAGTVINSHAFYYDPAIGGTTTAGFQFDGPVLGVILNDGAFPDPFVASDYLIPGIVPAGNIPGSHFAARGLELGINIDHLTVLPAGVSFTLSAGSPGDQLRVITAPVPEPGIGALILVAGAVFWAGRRREGLLKSEA
jgi:hypothetical protein